ncbi:cysteine--tRNA ligase [Engelhardtia mirabilis]|uniref:Cysteine--tRNA ligase n=1 Tax=Engelhardtia mirabilis TaxID=2528011 RepID=A0A518BLD2_9BACT|nr:Cysteine--tRNA ligase [Planctomycetes bacterium Pla133]QDV02104.1 Cysteine--tRNA ligase [Planctomycetes bacterium Pla86]
MSIQIHNTLTRASQTLKTLEPGEVRLYVCGPTVYDDSHIGHLMGPVLFDAMARWLIARGYRVRFVVNITDIDDKIIRRAAQTGEPWDSIASRYTEQYFEHLRALGVATITDHPRCTDFVPQMVRFIEDLIAQGRAYAAADGVYFDVGQQEGYGKLSGRHLDDMQSGERVERPGDLRHPADFALWKLAKPGEPSWESPWGAGRPGWHLECSVMSSELLGPVFDIHGGGDDLKFPHHENEIAQSEAHGDAYAQLWMHHGLVQFGGRKVAKSDPRMAEPEFARQFNATWLRETYGAPTLRFFLLRGHYRRPIDFEPTSVEGARTGLQRLLADLGPLLDEPVAAADLDELIGRDAPASVAAHRDAFVRAMDNDFGTGEAVGALFSIAKEARALGGDEALAAKRLLRDLGRLLGLFQPGDLELVQGAGKAEVDDALVGGLVELLIELRGEARERRDFATSDRVRDRLAELGIELKDGADGTTWDLA